MALDMHHVLAKKIVTLFSVFLHFLQHCFRFVYLCVCMHKVAISIFQGLGTLWSPSALFAKFLNMRGIRSSQAGWKVMVFIWLNSNEMFHKTYRTWNIYYFAKIHFFSIQHLKMMLMLILMLGIQIWNWFIGLEQINWISRPLFIIHSGQFQYRTGLIHDHFECFDWIMAPV